MIFKASPWDPRTWEVPLAGEGWVRPATGLPVWEPIASRLPCGDERRSPFVAAAIALLSSEFPNASCRTEVCRHARQLETARHRGPPLLDAWSINIC